MAKKVLGAARSAVGRPGSRRRRWATLLSAAVIVAAGLFFIQNVLAVHDTGAFELDGNATTQTSHDWADIYNDVTNGTNTSGATAKSFTSDNLVDNGPSLQATIFQGGGSKDPHDVSDWAWKDGAGGLPDKDNLLHAFAARYSLPATDPAGPPTPNPCFNGTGGPGQPAFDASKPCEVLFFGSDRYDNSGDAQQGFWFFQNAIGLGNNSMGGGFGFTGVHAPGDLLIISDFSNGGTTSTIKIFQWDPACTATNKPDGTCADANLRSLASSDAANCLTVGGGDAFCGIVNPGPGLTTSPWDFNDKSGNPNFLNGEFYEGGVNLSVLGLADECFSTIGAETRSSTSTTATLKDFVLGQFAVCNATLTTTPSAGAGGSVSPGVSVTDLAVVQGSGTATPPTPTGDVTFYLCNESQLTPATTGTCQSGGTNIGAVTLADSSPPPGEASATSAAVNTVASPLSPGRYCFRAEWPGDSNYTAGPYVHFGSGNSECFVVSVITTSASSAQNWLPNDSGTITAGVAGTLLNGTLTFQLYTGNNCGATSGSAVSGQLYSHTLTNAVSPVTRSTSNSTFLVTASASYSWLVTFTSTDAGVTGSSHCEVTSLTITN